MIRTILKVKIRAAPRTGSDGRDVADGGTEVCLTRLRH